MFRPSGRERFQGIDDLPLIIVVSNALIALFQLFRPGMAGYLGLSHGALRAGEYWRLVTFLFVPPRMGPIFLFFWIYLLYMYASALEAAWGTRRFTIFFLVGAAATALVALYPSPFPVSNAFLQASLFLAFAALFPDMELYLFFVIPLKVKVLGYLTWAGLAWGFWRGVDVDRLAVGAALVNYFLLLGPDLWSKARLRWQVIQNRRRWRP